MLYLLKFVAWLKFIKITCLPPCFYLYLTFLKQGFCPFCIPSQLSYKAAFTALGCKQLFLHSMLHVTPSVTHLHSNHYQSISFISIQIVRAVRKKCFCSFSAIAVCLVLCNSALSAGSPGSVAAVVQTLFSGALALHQAGQGEGGSCCKLVLSIPVNICQVKSWQWVGKVTAAKRKLLSSKKYWREVD